MINIKFFRHSHARATPQMDHDHELNQPPIDKSKNWNLFDDNNQCK